MSVSRKAQQMSFLEAPPARGSVSREAARVLPTSVISGLKCIESSQQFAPAPSLLRMCAEALQDAIISQTRYSVTWKVWGMPARHFLFRLVYSVLPTSDTEYSLWPTPTARDWRSGRVSEKTLAKNVRPLNEAVTAIADHTYLNPDWVEVMMGLPPGWPSLAGLPVRERSSMIMSRRARRQRRAQKRASVSKRLETQWSGSRHILSPARSVNGSRW